MAALKASLGKSASKTAGRMPPKRAPRATASRAKKPARRAKAA
jgi:hypothetical protein